MNPNFYKKDFKRLFKSFNYPQRYKGDFFEIGTQIIKDRWVDKFFVVGSGLSINNFWLRDFGFSVDSLLNLGYFKEVDQTIDYILNIYKRSNKVTTTISLFDYPYDVFTYATDSLPWLIYIIKKSSNKNLLVDNKEFINYLVEDYYSKVFDVTTNLVKGNKRYSEPKDVVKTKSTMVNNTFMLWLIKLLEETPGLVNPFPKFLNVKDTIFSKYWNKDHFKNDLDENLHIEFSSDSNLWPYALNLFTEKELIQNSLEMIDRHNLNLPFPLKYHQYALPGKFYYPINRLLVPNYQGNSIWLLNTHYYLDLLSRFSKSRANEYLNIIIEKTEFLGNFYEVFEVDGGSPLRGRLGIDIGKGMLWICNYMNLKNKFNESSK